MRLRTPRLAMALGLMIASPTLAGAVEAHGVALLVVNRNYEGMAESVSIPDIRPLAGALQGRGFVTRIREDVGGEELRSLIERFLKSAPTNGVAFLYLAGRLISAEAEGGVDEYLLPVDVEPGDVADKSIGVRGVLDLIRSTSGAMFSYLVLEGTTPHAPRSEGAPPQSPRPRISSDEGVMLGYAGNGFTQSFVAHLGDPKVNIPTALGAAAGVTNGWISGSAAPPPSLRPASGPPTQIAKGIEAGAEWVNALGTVFCWCPPGEFGMGSEGATPSRTVRFEHGFWLGKYEVTKREFDLVTLKKPRNALAVRPTHPRDGIRYDDILQFVDELNRRERFFGRLPKDWEYALPTESEWEYACRAGTESIFYFGNEPDRLPEHANFADRRLLDTGDEYYHYAEGRLDDGTARLAEVGRYRPNPWGFHDLYGNLWEWTATIEEVQGRQYPVARGGSWVSLPEYCRSDFRHRFETTTERNFIGFRLVLRRTGSGRER